ncbi:MAG: glycerate kinase [Akkermansiaceae bacterium]
MKILIACDKFKGSLSAREACEAIAAGLPDHDHDLAPIADGGEGFVAALLSATEGEKVTAQCRDAVGREVSADYALLANGSAVIEMSAASGLWRIEEEERDPLFASTYGTGELMKHAIEVSQATRLLIGIGGSATNDGGAGMAEALGVKFLDQKGLPLILIPETYPEIDTIDPSEMIPLPPITVACDVSNPLLGPNGATAVFGPQKGASTETIPQLEAALTSLVKHLKAEHDFPGAGAAGGLGFGLKHFCKAELVSGFDLVADALHLRQKIAQADIVITGEGSLDEQTLDGKGPAGIARLAREADKKVIGIAGQVTEEAKPLFDETYSLTDLNLPLETLINEAAPLLTKLVSLAHFKV